MKYYYKIKRFISHIYYRIKDGVSYKDTWCLSCYINNIIYEGLIKFKKVNNGIPFEFTEEEWDYILDLMIEGYGLKIQDKIYDYNEMYIDMKNLFYTEEEEKKIKEAEKYFTQNSKYLWR